MQRRQPLLNKLHEAPTGPGGGSVVEHVVHSRAAEAEHRAVAQMLEDHRHMTRAGRVEGRLEMAAPGTVRDAERPPQEYVATGRRHELDSLARGVVGDGAAEH